LKTCNFGWFMQSTGKLRSFSIAFCACAALIAAPAFAQHGGGGHGGGGGHSGGGGWHGGGGGWHGGGGGWHGGGGGWRGGFYGPWGWGLGGLGLGLYFATLPYYYSTYWWGGVPYYYADDNYYIWNSGVGQYQTVAPPAEILNQAGGPGAGGQALGTHRLSEERSEPGAAGQGQVRMPSLGRDADGV
jgi:hypothetical protein